jgi:hypothetical protein
MPDVAQPKQDLSEHLSGEAVQVDVMRVDEWCSRAVGWGRGDKRGAEMITVAPGFIDVDEGEGGALHVALIDCGDHDEARRGLESAARAVYGVPHPEEPHDSLPNYVSELEEIPAGWVVWFDFQDIADDNPELMQQVLDAMLGGLAEAGVTNGTLTSYEVQYDED